MKIDLHVHTDVSRCSTQSVETVYNKAVEQEVDIIAVTDHQSVSGVQKLLKLREQRHGSMKVIPGIEMIFRYKGGLNDVLGYGGDLDAMGQMPILERYKDKEIQILERLYVKFTRMGYRLRPLYELAKDLVDRDTYSTLIIEECLNLPENLRITELSGFANTTQARKFYWKQIQSELDEINYPNLEEVSHALRETGCLVSMAHKTRMKRHMLRVLNDATDRNLISMAEVHHGEHSSSDIAFFNHYCDMNGLYRTGGSDNHFEVERLALSKDDQKKLQQNPLAKVKPLVPLSAVEPWLDKVRII